MKFHHISLEKFETLANNTYHKHLHI